MKKINDILFSFFNPPVSNTTPAKSVTLEEVHQMIVSDLLKKATGLIRKGKALKGKILPSVTFSALFSRRCKTGVLEYSGLIVLDIDELDFASTLKWRISIDVFLKAVLLFISPRGKGLKIVVRVKDGKPEEHELYFLAIARYLKGVFGIGADESGKDIPRLCFLCWDPAACFNPNGYVEREALLRLLPPAAATAAATATATATAAAAAASDDPEIDRLNNLPAVLNRAFAALRNAGWKQLKNPDRWSRPNGEQGKVSAIFNYFEAEKRWVMTVFSSNAKPLERKGYNPIGVICELEFGGDFEACMAELKTMINDQ